MSHPVRPVFSVAPVTVSTDPRRHGTNKNTDPDLTHTLLPVHWQIFLSCHNIQYRVYYPPPVYPNSIVLSSSSSYHPDTLLGPGVIAETSLSANKYTWSYQPYMFPPLPSVNHICPIISTVHVPIISDTLWCQELSLSLQSLLITYARAHHLVTMLVPGIIVEFSFLGSYLCPG